jgi:hypothetical protein
MSAQRPAFPVFPSPEVQRSLPGRRIRDRVAMYASEDRAASAGLVRSTRLEIALPVVSPTSGTRADAADLAPVLDGWLSQPSRPAGR